MSVMTVSGGRYWCERSGEACVQLQPGESVFVDVLVVARKPLGFEFILGMNGIRALGGAAVSSGDRVRFGVEMPVSHVAASVTAPGDCVSSDDERAGVSGAAAVTARVSHAQAESSEVAPVSGAVASAAPTNRADNGEEGLVLGAAAAEIFCIVYKYFVVTFDERLRMRSPAELGLTLALAGHFP